MTQKNRNTAPAKACFFEIPSDSVRFASQEAESNNFTMIGYSGEIIPKHWYWGNLAFDLEGLSFEGEVTPVFEDHCTSLRVGVASSRKITDKVEFAGQFLNNDNAQKLKNDMKDGFPMQASLGLPPSIIERIEEGESVDVNGYKLEGPGTVFRKAAIREVSMCAFGADSHTESKAFADGGKEEISFNFKEQNMSDKKAEMTVDTFAAEHPDIFKEVQVKAKDDGRAELAEQFKKFKELFGEDSSFLVEQFGEGKSLDEAKDAFIKKLKTDNKAQAEEFAKKAADDSKKPIKVDPANSEFSDEQDEGTKEFNEQTATEDQLAEQFKGDIDLQSEFGSLEVYQAFITANKNGQVAIQAK